MKLSFVIFLFVLTAAVTAQRKKKVPKSCMTCMAFDSAATCAQDSKNTLKMCGSKTTRCVAYEQEDENGYFFSRGCTDEDTFKNMKNDCRKGGKLAGKCSVGFCRKTGCKAEV